MINWALLDEEDVVRPVNDMMKWMGAFFRLQGIERYWGKGEQDVTVQIDKWLIRGQPEITYAGVITASTSPTIASPSLSVSTLQHPLFRMHAAVRRHPPP